MRRQASQASGGGRQVSLEELQVKLQTAVDRAFATIHEIEDEREQIRNDRDLLEAQRDTLETAKAELQEAQEEVSRLREKADRGGVFGCCRQPPTSTAQEFVTDQYEDDGFR